MGFDLRLERLIQAPRERVFAAWADPAQVRLWFTPQPLGTGVCSIDFKVGGQWAHEMIMPDGAKHTMQARYTEIVAPEKLVWEADLAQMPGSCIVTTVTFEAEGQATRLKVRQVFEGGDVPIADAQAGWNMTLDQLAGLFSPS